MRKLLLVLLAYTSIGSLRGLIEVHVIHGYSCSSTDKPDQFWLDCLMDGIVFPLYYSLASPFLALINVWVAFTYTNNIAIWLVSLLTIVSGLAIFICSICYLARESRQWFRFLVLSIFLFFLSDAYQLRLLEPTYATMNASVPN